MIPEDGFVLELQRVPRSGVTRWQNAKGTRYYEWDFLHGEWEVYDRKGYHLGAADAETGKLIKPAKSGRTIDV